ncbi:MAG: chemotaxis protein CheW [Alcanivoracaceae bacterium]|nr:chemotaxis protein CheW [Alcanivoracaceae bacterium]
MKNDKRSELLAQRTWTLVSVSGRQYGLPSANVIQSLRAPKIQAVPFVPAHVAGIAQVDGEILPCLDLARLFGAKVDDTVAGEALVIEHQDRRTVLLVDSAQRQVQLDDDDDDAIAALDGEQEEGQAVIGELRHGSSTVLLLDPASLSHFSAQRAPSQGRPGLVASQLETATDADPTENLDTLFLYVSINDQAYALRVTDVQEIVEIDAVAALPGAPPGLSGIALVRDNSHLVVDAGECLGLGHTGTQQAVIIPVSQGELLLAISGIDAVRAVARHQVRPVGDTGARLDAVIELPGEAVRAVINPQALVDAIHGVRQFVPAARRTEDSTREQEAILRFLVVMWGNERFALPLEKVQRLDPPATVRRVDSELFEGVINTGGDVVPVLHPQQFYGMAHQASELEGFMIIARDKVTYAVPLEHAEQIIDVPASALQRTQGTGDQRFCGSIRHGDSLISAVELSHFHQLASAAQKELP